MKINSEDAREHGRGIGALLRATRIRCAEDLPEVARTLRIRAPYLEAIEEGRFRDLPGTTYATGFIRSYAEYLGLDADEVIRRYRLEVGPGPQADLRLPTPVTERGVPSGAVLLVGAAIALAAYGAWFVKSSENRPLVDMIPKLPDRLVALLPGDPPETADVPRPEAATPAPPPSTTAPAPDASASLALGLPPSRDDAGADAPGTPAATPPPPETPASPEATSDTGATAPEATTELAAAATTQSLTPEPTSGAEDSADATDAASAPPPAEVAAAAEPQTESDRAVEPDLIAVAPPPPAPAATPVPEPKPLRPETPSAATASASDVPRAPTFRPPVTVRPFGAGGADSRIQVTAMTDSWIQIRESDTNRLIVTRLLRSGDTFRVPDRDGLKLVTGNAGGLQIRVDGTLVPSLGPIGTVLRDVALDVGRLQAGTATGN